MGSLISSKKTNENKSTWGIIGVKSSSFVRFLDTKNHFEIIWPLVAWNILRHYRILQRWWWCLLFHILTALLESCNGKNSSFVFKKLLVFFWSAIFIMIAWTPLVKLLVFNGIFELDKTYDFKSIWIHCVSRQDWKVAGLGWMTHVRRLDNQIYMDQIKKFSAPNIATACITK